MYTIGIDLGGTGIQAGVVDENNNIIGRGERPTAMPRPADEIMDDAAAACRDAVQQAGCFPNQGSNPHLCSESTKS